MATSRGRPDRNRSIFSSNGTSITSKSSGSAPGATPTATRPGNRAASQATSSATSATGRSGRSIGHGAHHPVRIASSSQPVTCSGLGEYPAKPPWCSLVITPSKPTSAASAAWARSSSTMPVASSPLCG